MKTAMDFSYLRGTSSDEASSNPRKVGKYFHRHSPEQIQQLEEFFKDCPNPDEIQRANLGKKLGLRPRQVKFWFQNKRNQVRIQKDREINVALREENSRIHLENLTMQEMLSNPRCPVCDGDGFDEEEARRQNLERLRHENAWLKEQLQSLADSIAVFRGMPGF